jgi:hypothetical protein
MKPLTRFEAQIEAALEPFREAVKRLETIPGADLATHHARNRDRRGLDLSAAIHKKGFTPE